MIESMLPLGWEGLNSDQKYEICGKSVHLRTLFGGLILAPLRCFYLRLYLPVNAYIFITV